MPASVGLSHCNSFWGFLTYHANACAEPACGHVDPPRWAELIRRCPGDTRESGTGSEGEGLEIVKGAPQKDKMELAPGSTAVYYLSPFVPLARRSKRRQ